MSDLVMVHGTVASAGEALMTVAEAVEPAWCPALGASGCVGVDEAVAQVWTSLERVLVAMPTELVALARAASDAAEAMTAVDRQLAGGAS